MTGSEARHQRAAFDYQATSFDRRAGLPDQYCPEIARTILELAEVQSGELIVEVGAGTGQIGQWLARSPAFYIGFDLSARMLEQFQERIQDAKITQWSLLEADGNQTWPVGDGSAKAIFSSRSLHLLETERVLAESYRVARHGGAILLIGRVERSPESVKAKMQQKMRELMAERGYTGRGGRQFKEQLIEALRQRGATAIEPVTAARWSVSSSPQDSIANWQNKPGLGGIETLPQEDKRMILQELTHWAKATFGEIEHPITSEEAYVLQGVYLNQTE